MRFTFFGFVLFLSGCSSPKISGETTSHFRLADLPVFSLDAKQIRWAEYKVENENEGRRYLAALQANLSKVSITDIDPYTNKEDLPVECQTKNLPLVIKNENLKEISIATNLYSSEEFVLGCAGARRVKAQSLLLYCKESHVVISIVALLAKEAGAWPSQGVATCE